MSPEKRALISTTLAFGAAIVVVAFIAGMLLLGVWGLVILVVSLLGLAFWSVYQMAVAEEQYFDLLKKMNEIKND